MQICFTTATTCKTAASQSKQGYYIQLSQKAIQMSATKKNAKAKGLTKSDLRLVW